MARRNRARYLAGASFIALSFTMAGTIDRADAALAPQGDGKRASAASGELKSTAIALPALTPFRDLLSVPGGAPTPEGVVAQSVTRDGYTESGLGANNLTYEETTAEALRGGIELALEYESEVSFGGVMRGFTTEVRGGFLQELALDDRDVAVTNPTLGSGLVLGDDDDRTMMTLGAGASLEVSDSATVFMGYDAELAGDQQAHTVNLGVRFSW